MDTRMQFIIVDRHMAELRDEAAQDRLAKPSRKAMLRVERRAAPRSVDTAVRRAA